MNRNRSILAVVLVLALVTMACGLRINLPIEDVKTGSLQTEQIEVPEPDAQSADVEIEFGAGELTLGPGADNGLVSGTATYNVEDLKPVVDVSGSRVVVSTGDLNIEGFPRFNDNIRNEWNLKFSDMPIDLRIQAGAYQGEFELGGLSLQSVEISDGASDVEVNFSTPNLIEMDRMSYDTGASSVRLNNLANANFRSMSFSSGAGDYTLDFSGELQQDATVRIESGVSTVTIIVPSGTSAIVNFDGALTNIDLDGNWQRSGDEYRLDGSGHTLNIVIDMGAGNLELREK